jgi:hypothetical protein
VYFDLLNSNVNKYHAIEIILSSERSLYSFLFFLLRFGPYSGHGLFFHKASKSHSDTAYAAGLPQKGDQALGPLHYNTKHSQRTDMGAVSGILSGYSQTHSIYWSNKIKHKAVKTK